MASSEHGDKIQTQLAAQGINTRAEIATLRAGKRNETGTMKTALEALQASTGKLWFSRKRVRSDALKLLKEGAL